MATKTVQDLALESTPAGGDHVIIDDGTTTRKATVASVVSAGVDLSAVAEDILPDTDDVRSLGSATKMWQDVYVGPGSLYVNGQKVLEDSSGTIIVSADDNQNLDIKTTGTGDIGLTTAVGGKVEVGGTLEIAAGKNVTSSDGNAISFTNGLDLNGEAITNVAAGSLDAAALTGTLPAISGANLTGIDAVVVGTTLPNPVSTEGSLFYKSDTDVFYISNGTQWNLVYASPTTTGGTVTIDALSEGGTFTYDLGTDFTDDVDTDAQLTYTLTSGTMPSGCTLPTTGNSALTGTASGVSSNTNYTFTIKVTDTSGGTATQNYQQTINTVVPTSTGGTVTISSVGEGSSASYDVDTNFTFTTGSAFSAYSLLSGSLPSGLSLNTSTGVISGTMGTVSADTAYSFTIRGTDTDGDTVDQAYSWTITDTPFSATGGTITTYSSGSTNYKVHTFTSSGTFTANKSGSVDVLVVAGGGAGGGSSNTDIASGGGGAGGYRTATSFSVTSQAYSVVIGGGGTGPSGFHIGGSGGVSSFGGTSTVGGGGGGTWSAAPSSGGSGGGAGENNTGNGAATIAGAAGTSGQGNAGGNSDGTYDNNLRSAGAGGGGAGGVGGNTPNVNAAGQGGAGSNNNYRTGSNITYAGGGSGAAYVTGATTTGGGGVGKVGTTGAGGAGSANTGGGGGGALTNVNEAEGAGGNGGSGIVVIRYAV